MDPFLNIDFLNDFVVWYIDIKTWVTWFNKPTMKTKSAALYIKFEAKRFLDNNLESV